MLASKCVFLFIQENQAENPKLREYMSAVEGLGKYLEQMTFSARSRQTSMQDHFPPAKSGRGTILLMRGEGDTKDSNTMEDSNNG